MGEFYIPSVSFLQPVAALTLQKPQQSCAASTCGLSVLESRDAWRGERHTRHPRDSSAIPPQEGQKDAAPTSSMDSRPSSLRDVGDSQRGAPQICLLRSLGQSHQNLLPAKAKGSMLIYTHLLPGAANLMHLYENVLRWEQLDENGWCCCHLQPICGFIGKIRTDDLELLQHVYSRPHNQNENLRKQIWDRYTFEKKCHI